MHFIPIVVGDLTVIFHDSFCACDSKSIKQYNYWKLLCLLGLINEILVVLSKMTIFSLTHSCFSNWNYAFKEGYRVDIWMFCD